MIRRLSIRNYQSLAEIDLDLQPFTVIVGESNSGKSAVRRALASLVRNDPAGGRVRAGTQMTTVAVDLDDDQSIRWEKGTGRNAYVLNGNTLDKPGATAPEPVERCLRMSTDLHLATQFDPPYLLTETPSHAAKELGGLTNIATLYEAIRESERQRKDAKKKAGATSELAVEAEEELAAFSDLQGESDALQHINDLLHVASAKENARAVLSTAVADAVRQRTTLEAARTALLTVGQIDTAPAKLAEADAHLQRAQVLGSDLGRARRAEQSVQATVHPVPDIDLNDITTLVMHADALSLSHQRAVELSAKRERLGNQVQALLQEQDRIANDLSKITTCPTCDQPMTHEEAA